MPEESSAKGPGWQRAIVIGASSGIGEAIARELTKQGSRVAILGRRGERLEEIAGDLNKERANVFPYVHDVLHTEEIPELFQRIATDLGGVDLVVYASGVMPATGLSEYPTDEDLNAIEVNFAGAVAWLNEAAKRFSVARSGTIIGISSIAGDRGRAGNPVYNATKAALASYLESLRNRLARKGVTVLTVKPGLVRTELFEGGKLPAFAIARPDAVARHVLNAARTGRRVIYTPPWWRYVAWVVRSIPAPIMERLKVP